MEIEIETSINREGDISSEKWMDKEASKQIGKGNESGKQKRTGDKDRE